MDIASTSQALSQNQLITNVNISMLKKSLDTIDTLGDSMINMMEQSVAPNLGQNIDIKL